MHGIFALVGVVGFVVTGLSMTYWAPESFTRLPDESQVLARAATDSQALGYRVSGEPQMSVSHGLRLYHSAGDVSVLTEHVPDTELRRRLMERIPPVRLGARYWRATSPEGSEGALFLEYDGDGELLGAAFGFDGVLGDGLAVESDRFVAKRLARLFLERAPPEPQVFTSSGYTELLYTAGPEEGAIYVHLTNVGAWVAFRVPYPYRVVHSQTFVIWQQSPAVQFQIYVLIFAALVALGVLMWRLGQRRAGMAHALPVIAVLAVSALPVLRYWQTRPGFLVLIGFFYILPVLGLLLAWAVAEAEVRDVRPSSLIHWDRLLRLRPVCETGVRLLRGVAAGFGMAGLYTVGGQVATVFSNIGFGSGGFGGVHLMLPAFWMTPTPMHRGVALTAMSAFIVGLGGRLGGRIGAMAGAAISACGWATIMPVAPLEWNFAFSLAVAMVAGWIVWHEGLMELTVASITMFSLPTAWFVLQHAPVLHWDVALLSSLPLWTTMLGLYWARTAPRTDLAAALVPNYVSALEQETRLQAEVGLLRDIQLSLLPPQRPCSNGLDLAWRMIPADLVGGDFLDLVEDSTGRVWMAVADVAGHGISCSLLTAYTKAAVAQYAVSGASPAEALSGIRWLFARLQSRRTLVTLLLACWDPRTQELKVTSAGHPHLLVYRPPRDGEEGPGKVEEIGVTALPLGSSLPGTDRQETVHCPPGSIVVAYTDGVVEAEDPAGRQLGYDPWPELLPSLADLPSEDILQALLGAVDEHCAGRAKGDDVTTLVMKVE